MTDIRTAPTRSSTVHEANWGLLDPWIRFWFSPQDPICLHALRVLGGIFFLSWLLPLAGHVEALFSLQGWFDLAALSEAASMTPGPPRPLGWSLLYLFKNSAGAVTAFYWLSILVLVLFTLGLWTRLTAVLTYAIVVSFTSNPATYFDADIYLVILAFYLMVGYVLLGQRTSDASWTFRLLGPKGTFLFGKTAPVNPKEWHPRQPSVGANLAVRLFQVHFAIVMLTSALNKLQFMDWWSGAAFWYPLYPPFKTQLSKVRALAPVGAFYLTVISIMTYAALVWQLAFPAFAWKKYWRFLLVGGAVIGWLGMAFLYQLPLFGPALVVGCLSYLTPAEWRRIASWLAYIPGLNRLVSRPIVVPVATTERTQKKGEPLTVVAVKGN